MCPYKFGATGVTSHGTVVPGGLTFYYGLFIYF